MPGWSILVIVIVVIVVIAAAIFVMTGKQRNERRRERAEQLRHEATTQASVLPESQREAEDLRAKADLAKSEARRAEQRAANAEQGHRIEQAKYEDRLREADRLDPEVDHKADDYQPDVWNDERSEDGPGKPGATTADAAVTSGSASASPASTAGARADTPPSTTRPQEKPEDISVAQRTEDPEAEAAATSPEPRTHRRAED